MNHTIRYCFLFLLLPFQFLGQQNLILNGDFEEYWECPDDVAQIERCKYVYNPCIIASVSTSDYFNSCATISGGFSVDIPETTFGFQTPKSGNGMIGFASENDFVNNSDYREYVEFTFSKPLVCGNTYRFESYINLSNFNRYSLKGFGFYFSVNELNEEGYLYNSYTPQVIDTTTIVSDTLAWTKLSFDFVADKPFSFLSIGNLKSKGVSDYTDLFPLAIGQEYFSYFYIDSVSIFQVKENNLEVPNVFTPNNDGINDFIYPLGETNFVEKMVLINRWGDEVINLDHPFIWNGMANNGDELLNGIYFYTLKFNEGCNQGQKHGMIHLIR